MTYKKRGRFLDSSDGRWVICRLENSKFGEGRGYFIFDKVANDYVKEDYGFTRYWIYLRDAKKYIEEYYIQCEQKS